LGNKAGRKPLNPVTARHPLPFVGIYVPCDFLFRKGGKFDLTACRSAVDIFRIAVIEGYRGKYGMLFSRQFFQHFGCFIMIRRFAEYAFSKSNYRIRAANPLRRGGFHDFHRPIYLFYRKLGGKFSRIRLVYLVFVNMGDTCVEGQSQ